MAQLLMPQFQQKLTMLKLINKIALAIVTPRLVRGMYQMQLCRSKWIAYTKNALINSFVQVAP